MVFQSILVFIILPKAVNSYSPRCSQSGGNFLVIAKFQPSINKSVKFTGLTSSKYVKQKFEIHWLYICNIEL